MPTERYRVTLPKDARRPYQVVTGLLGYPRVAFDALTPFDLPMSSRKRTLPRVVVDQLITAGGQSVGVYLRQVLRRDGVKLEPGQNPLDHVPGKVYGELLEHFELASTAASKWLSPLNGQDATAPVRHRPLAAEVPVEDHEQQPAQYAHEARPRRNETLMDRAGVRSQRRV